METITAIRDFAYGKDLKKNKVDEIDRSGTLVLNSVSFSLSAVSILFLIAFHLNGSVSLTWFFLAEAIAFALIPLLVRQTYENAAKLLMIAYVDIGIVILSAVFGKEALIQTFFVPAMGLSILLFDHRHVRMRSIGVAFSVVSYFVLDYIIFQQVDLTDDRMVVLKWSILAAAFISTWLIFNTFSDIKEKAEKEMHELLAESQELNKQLQIREKELEDNLAKLREAKVRVEEGSKAKTQFLSTMSHEIRTPMNAIIGMTNLLSQQNPREDQVEQIEILDFSAKTLLSLINDVLDFSKIESGKIEFENTRFELVSLVKGVYESFHYKAESKGIELHYRIDPSVPDNIVGDPARLTQILNNLVSNALKFTEEGEVEIAVDVVEKRDNEVKMAFLIKDTGIGIPPDKQDHIFKSFTQARADTTRRFGGTGLGLAISKQLTELQGGAIKLSSQLGKGSTFRVYLTFETPAKEGGSASIAEEPTHEVSDLAGTRVLLVEDNLVNQKVASRFFEMWNVEVTIANNGREALDIYSESDFDLVLMDLQMPEMDGYEAAARIRALSDDKKRKVPIIALTAAALKEVKSEVNNAGMDDFISKPFKPDMLKGILNRYRIGANGSPA